MQGAGVTHSPFNTLLPSAIACESNKAAVTHLLVVLELTHASVQDVTTLEVFIPSVFAT